MTRGVRHGRRWARGVARSGTRVRRSDPAIRFYKRLGATLLTDWRICRLDETQMSRVAGTLTIPETGG
jgi:hypothetical protein